MLPDRVSNPGHLTYESGALPIALRGPASSVITEILENVKIFAHRRRRQLRHQGYDKTAELTRGPKGPESLT